jgi:hypothetical protein
MLIDVNLKQPYVAGTEGALERIGDFVDALHGAVERLEVAQAIEFIRKCAREREAAA